MSFLYCLIDNFPIALARRMRPELVGRPLALLNERSRICALSVEASRCGLLLQMNVHKARSLCDGLRLLPMHEVPCAVEQNRLLLILTNWDVPVEAFGWGEACLDLCALTTRRSEAQLLARDVGQAVRHKLGTDLEPKLGWGPTPLIAQRAAKNVEAGMIRLAAPHRSNAEEPITSQGSFPMAQHRKSHRQPVLLEPTHHHRMVTWSQSGIIELITNYGPIFWRPRLVAPSHPLAEERSDFIRLRQC